MKYLRKLVTHKIKLFEMFEYDGLPENWQIVLKEVSDLTYILEDMGYIVDVENKSIKELPNTIVIEIDTYCIDEKGFVDPYKTQKISKCPEFQEFFDRVREICSENKLHIFFVYPGEDRKIWICNKSEKEMNEEK